MTTDTKIETLIDLLRDETAMISRDGIALRYSFDAWEVRALLDALEQVTAERDALRRSVLMSNEALAKRVDEVVRGRIETGVELERAVKAEAERDAALAAIREAKAWVVANAEFMARPMAWEIRRILSRALGGQTESRPTRCDRDIPGTVPTWAGRDQIDPCTCVRPRGHASGCACAHDHPRDAVALDGQTENGERTMTSEYTPTTYEIRARTITDGGVAIVSRRDGVTASRAEVVAGEEFDRWLAAHDAEVRAAAEKARDTIAKELTRTYRKLDTALADQGKSQITEHSERAVLMVDRIAKSTGMTRAEVVETINSIGKPQITDRMVEAGARALNPIAWQVYDQADDLDEWGRSTIVNQSRLDARAVLEAALSTDPEDER